MYAIVNYLASLDKPDQDEQVSVHAKNLIFDMYGAQSTTVEEYIESNRNIQEVGLFLFMQPRVQERLSDCADMQTVAENSLCGLAANIAARRMAINSINSETYGEMMQRDNYHTANDFEEYFIITLNNICKRIDEGEYVGQLHHDLGNEYPVWKEIS